MTHRFRPRAAAALVAAAAVIGPVSAAQASDATLRATVKRDVPKIIRSQAKILDGIATYQKTHSVTSLIKAIKTQNTDLKSLHKTLSRESASSANGTKGKADILSGLALIERSNNTLVTQLGLQADGKKVSTAAVKSATKQAVKGNDELNVGAKLLKV